ncbi:restriction endonuclease subunit S [Clavibacter zhangzhiyongii]|uniref:restriction endonuclease subunit S n=1 Tax=Clavibacter zhangzhiyongii TaxID=2768071 RepID=UPI00195C56DA|nr:restriction endonuclease subunit S [Clavibacter zhangzhiyongii]MBM7026131.1 restriction endonuclease subunit S [Clavibacter zhangzhiyongii]
MTARLGDVALIQRQSVNPNKIDPNTIYLGLEHLARGGRIIGHETVGSAALSSSKFTFSAKHVLYGKLRPNLGKISRPTFSGVCSTDILPVLPGPHLDRDYLAHYLSQPVMVEFASSRAAGANLPRLSPSVLNEFEIPLPRLEEQRRIAAILDHAETLRTKRRRLLASLDSLAPRRFDEVFADRAGHRVPMGRLIDEQQMVWIVVLVSRAPIARTDI